MLAERAKLQRRHTDVLAEEVFLPNEVARGAMVCYRSTGIGIFGVFMRFVGMPLEKIALFMNSSQVSGSAHQQLAASVRLTFEKGLLSPYRVVGTASIAAWFFQYSVMGFAFQFFDNALSKAFGVRPMYYGPELMTSASSDGAGVSAAQAAKTATKTALAPIFSGSLEALVANRAEVQRAAELPCRPAKAAVPRVRRPHDLKRHGPNPNPDPNPNPAGASRG